MELREEVKYQLNELLEKEKERELLKADNELLKAKWEAQGLMIQKLHKEIEYLNELIETQQSELDAWRKEFMI